MLTFRIADMTCARCASAIARAVADIDEAARVEVDIQARLARISSAAGERELMEALCEAGYTPEKVSSAPATGSRSGGCGCGCAPGLPTPVDMPQSAASPRSTCCG